MSAVNIRNATCYIVLAGLASQIPVEASKGTREHQRHRQNQYCGGVRSGNALGGYTGLPSAENWRENARRWSVIS